MITALATALIVNGYVGQAQINELQSEKGEIQTNDYVIGRSPGPHGALEFGIKTESWSFVQLHISSMNTSKDSGTNFYGAIKHWSPDGWYVDTGIGWALLTKVEITQEGRIKDSPTHGPHSIVRAGYSYRDFNISAAYIVPLSDDAEHAVPFVGVGYSFSYKLKTDDWY